MIDFSTGTSPRTCTVIIISSCHPHNLHTLSEGLKPTSTLSEASNCTVLGSGISDLSHHWGTIQMHE